MKEIIKFVTVLFVFALVAGLSAPAKAADTSDVIAGIIFGGILGANIEKNRHPVEPYVTTFPYGTIIVPGYKLTRNMQCFFEMEADGMPKYAVPSCSTSGRSYYNRYSNSKILQQDMFPCGSYWGYGCGRLVQGLKDGTISGAFDFN